MPVTALVTPFGVRRFAHPKYATAAALVGTPWLVYEGDERHIYRDTPRYQTEAERNTIENQLEVPGYT